MVAIMVFGLFVWSIFQPNYAAWTYIAFLTVFEGWLLFGQYSAQTPQFESTLSESERVVLKKYRLYFRYPFASRKFSSALSAIQLATFIWVPWLFFSGQWVSAIIIVVNYFVAGPISMKLNPRSFLHDAVDRRGNYMFLEEMQAVDSVCERLSNKV